MKVQAEQSLAVVEDNAVAFEEHRARENYRPRVDGMDWSSRRNGKVQPLMPALHFSVEYPRSSEDVRDTRGCWREECAIPLPLRGHCRESLSLDFLVSGNRAQLFGAGFGELLRDFDFHRWIDRTPDFNFAGNLDFLPARHRFRDDQRVTSGSGLKRNSGQRIPELPRSMRKNDFVIQPRCRNRGCACRCGDFE